jgi:hypothetical protein
VSSLTGQRRHHMKSLGNTIYFMIIYIHIYIYRSHGQWFSFSTCTQDDDEAVEESPTSSRGDILVPRMSTASACVLCSKNCCGAVYPHSMDKSDPFDAKVCGRQGTAFINICLLLN